MKTFSTKMRIRRDEYDSTKMRIRRDEYDANLVVSKFVFIGISFGKFAYSYNFSRQRKAIKFGIGELFFGMYRVSNVIFKDTKLTP